jgi:hypothetical protein
VQKDLSVHEFSTENIVSMIFKDVSFESEVGGGVKTILKTAQQTNLKRSLNKKRWIGFLLFFCHKMN